MKEMFLVISIVLSGMNATAQTLKIPPGFSVRDSVRGDLNKDGTKELAVVYNTNRRDENEGVNRELVIYKLGRGEWVKWKKSGNAILGSMQGGMAGDPLDKILIDRNLLVVTQNGGGSWKWQYTDTYRYQNGKLYLIGYQNISGKACEYWQSVDFNLMTGKIVLKKEFEECSNSSPPGDEKETFYRRGLQITLEQRNTKEVKIISPKHKKVIYISSMIAKRKT